MAPAPQNPSPMVEHTRAHGRLAEAAFAGRSLAVEGVLARPVEVYVPERAGEGGDVLVHFHGAAFVGRHAVESTGSPVALVSVNLGAGSAAYAGPFAAPGLFARLLAAAEEALGWRRQRLWLSGFSAGYGALGAVLGRAEEAARVDGVLVLDGLHTGYVPEGCTLYRGGALEEGELAPFLAWARRARSGEKALLLTHSEVFPGAFASTTETADYLVEILEVQRQAVLEWGPLGMQQLSRARTGRLALMGYAGNSAPDHMDHLHALPYFLDLLLKL